MTDGNARQRLGGVLTPPPSPPPVGEGGRTRIPFLPRWGRTQEGGVTWCRGASKHALVLILLTAAACTPRDAGPATLGRGDAPEADPAEVPPQPIPEGVMAELVRQTERTRGLRALQPIAGVSVTDEQLQRHIREQIDAEDMEPAELIMRAFGFMPEGAGDLGEILASLLGEEVIGLYDPEDDRLMVRRGIAQDLGSNSPDAIEARAVLIHEVVHALQDQHFETLGQVGDDVWADDAVSSLDCLAEGDATLAMIVASLEAAGMDDSATRSPMFGRLIRQLGQMALPQSEALSSAPPYFGFVLGATYFEGAAFAAELRRQGGWSAVDEAHRSPPAGTFHILHPELYVERRQPEVVNLPEALPGLGEPEWHLVRSAVLGELETTAFLLPVGDAELAGEGAAGWAGDRFAVYAGPADAVALVWRLRFASAGEAEQFAIVARDATVAAGRGSCEELGTGGPAGAPAVALRCHDEQDWIVGVAPRDVIVLRAVPEGLAEELLRAVREVPQPTTDPSPETAPPATTEDQPVPPTGG